MNHRVTYPAFLIISLALIILPWLLNAQLQLVRYDTVLVRSGDDTLKLAWAGGLNSPQFSRVDLDGDGVKDLFLFERNFYGTVKTFINAGMEGKVAYTYAPFYRDAFPPMRNWALMADYDCDGHEDLFTDVPFGLAVYRNEYTLAIGLRFNKITSLLQTSTPEGVQPLFVGSPDIPSIADVDNDGDVDILTFGISGKSVEYHKNLSVENNGDCSEPEFELRNRCWGFFSENDNNNSITLFDTCDGNVPDPEQNTLHAGSTLLAMDLTGNGLKDLLLGDLSHNNIVMLENGGTESLAVMHHFDSLFPSNTLPVDVPVFPACFRLDADNDGKDDLIVAPNNPVRSENASSVWYYKNVAENGEAVFSFQTNRFLQNQMIDVGEGARPVFFDYDGDGLADIVVGNYGYFVSDGNYTSKLALLRNSGTVEKPEFTLVTDDYSQLSELGLRGIYPAFGDLNGDEKPEMVVGDEEGRLHLLVNAASTGEPAHFLLSAPAWFGIDVGQTAIPQVIDVDRDGKADLLVGGRSGTLNYFRNMGTASEPQFDAVATNSFFGGIDVMEECCTGYSAPFLAEDTTGSYQLYVGSETGWLYLFDQIEGNLEGNFRMVDSLFLHGVNITADGADINGDGRRELVYGELAGGIALLKTGRPAFIFQDENTSAGPGLKVYPNPARSHFYLELGGELQPKEFTLEIVSVFGQTIERRLLSGVGSGKNYVAVNHIPKGIYLVRVGWGHQLLSATLVIR